jgi:anti-sigma B factor antagonist
MDAPADRFAIAQLGTGTCIVAASGELERDGAASLKDALQTARDSAALSLIVDLTAVTFLDTALLAVLASEAARARHDGGDVVVVTHDPRLERVFEVSGLDGVVRVEHSLREAVWGHVAGAA